MYGSSPSTISRSSNNLSTSSVSCTICSSSASVSILIRIGGVNDVGGVGNTVFSSRNSSTGEFVFSLNSSTGEFVFS